ncbi:hypothetical protein COA17_11190 [Sphingomonas ginsenosidimutans]|jgi:hypothetical protein|uniref:Uncharacterized protein n=1 Tax=Sphingomonas ginsenosidimutans TaxID=862134 RepID=A0A2A4HUZ1_9SPHN|nr:hypothetical protein [Sphingomonas ginsenosidimutans]PCG08712.1 hypothetical protein COA17_11190 [Sphingomonas ginsenosidimutans]
MGDDRSAAQRSRATAIVHGAMLEALWSELLGRYDEPLEEAAAFAKRVLSAVRAAVADVAASDGRTLEALAIAEGAQMWERIMRGLAADEGPLPIHLPGSE